jgi:hypothetical protein
MLNSKNIYSIAFIITSIILFNANSYADLTGINDANAGQGNGQGHSQGNGKEQGQGKGHAKNQSSEKAKNNSANPNAAKSQDVKFANQDSETIARYYSAKPFTTSTLPPGIAMNLARGKPLPPGIQKVYLPSDLVSQLPAYPGYEYLGVGKDVLLVDSKTGIIADMLSNVLP